MQDIPLPQPGKPQPNKPAAPNPEELKTLKDKAVAALKQVYDPEIPVNIYELGLIYKVDVDEAAGRVTVDMTLTTPNCPEAQSLPAQARQELLALPEVSEAEVKIVWDPPWDKEMMSDEAKLHLGLM